MNINQVKQNSSKAAQWLKSIAHSDRLFILCQLINNELCVSELLENSKLSQSAFSQHLSLLRKQGLVKSRKQGLQVYYSLADERVIELLNFLHDAFCNTRTKK